MPAPSKRALGPLGETLLVFAGAALATAAITLAPSILPGIDAYVHVLVGAVFLLSAVRLARREPGGMQRFGMDLGGLLEPPDATDERSPGPLGLYDLARSIRAGLPQGLRELGFALIVAAIVFPPFVAGFWLFHSYGYDAASGQLTHVTLRAFRLDLPPDLWELALTQLVVVALPEEAFFRGYVQTRLGDRWAPRVRVLGATLSPPAWLLASALFAIVHFVSIPHPARLAVFFPGLLFGWMRARRGGIGAALVLHALSNVLADVLERGWLR